MNKPNPGQSNELEQQIREQVKRDEMAGQKPEIDRKPGQSQVQQDEQREREGGLEQDQRQEPLKGGESVGGPR